MDNNNNTNNNIYNTNNNIYDKNIEGQHFKCLSPARSLSKAQWCRHVLSIAGCVLIARGNAYKALVAAMPNAYKLVHVLSKQIYNTSDCIHHFSVIKISTFIM